MHSPKVPHKVTDIASSQYWEASFQLFRYLRLWESPFMYYIFSTKVPQPMPPASAAGHSCPFDAPGAGMMSAVPSLGRIQQLIPKLEATTFQQSYGGSYV